MEEDDCDLKDRLNSNTLLENAVVSSSGKVFASSITVSSNLHNRMRWPL
jgi:hypothetical protein